MGLLKNLKTIFHPDEIIAGFILEKKYQKTRKKIEGSIRFLAKKEVVITKITLTIEETIKLPKVAGEKERKTIISKIGSHIITGPLYLEPLKDHRTEFLVPINVSKKQIAEGKVYKGDYALMNKAHDQSKQTIFLYKILGQIKIKGKRKSMDISSDITIE